MSDVNFSKVIQNIPLMHTRASPRDKNLWIQRLKEEYQALIKYVEINKANDSDWFRIESNADGTKWHGTCWFMYNFQRYEFKLKFEIPVTYPMTAVELEIPELEGKTAKMYRGGKVCLTTHFNPLWIKSNGKFGIAHVLALGLSPWLAVEVPELVEKGLIKVKSNL